MNLIKSIIRLFNFNIVFFLVYCLLLAKMFIIIHYSFMEAHL